MIKDSTLVIDSFELRVVSIPLRVKVSHNLAQRETATNVLLKASAGGDKHGWGESCPREYVTGETIESVQRALADQFIPRYLGREFTSFEDVVAALSAEAEQLQRNEQAAFCALELAVLDLAGRHFQRSIADAIGGARRARFRYSGVLAANDLESVKNQAAMLHQFGFSEVKVKMATDLDFNREALASTRAMFGDEAELRVDANGAWTADEAIRQLTELQTFRLTGVEQPVAGEDFEAMAAVTAAEVTPVVADESLCSIGDAQRLVDERGCDIFNIRISKCGGLINSARIARMAMDAGMKCQLGAQVGETGILSAAGRHFAAAFSQLLWLEGSYDGHLLETQVTAPDITIQPGGHASAIDGYGHGITPISEAVDSVTVSRKYYERS